MKRWYANPVPDFGLRMVGVALLAIGWAIGERLHQVATGISVRDASFPMMLLAAIAFLCISTGSALFFVGAGLSEPVEVSERRDDHANGQRRRPRDQRTDCRRACLPHRQQRCGSECDEER